MGVALISNIIQDADLLRKGMSCTKLDKLQILPFTISVNLHAQIKENISLQ